MAMEDDQRSPQKNTSPVRASQASLRSTPVPESSQQARKRIPSLRRPQTVVTIHVGHEHAQETFVVHKDIICHHSPYFAAAFNGKLLEGTTQTMHLPDVDTDDFGQLVHWFYTQQFDIDAKDRGANILPFSQLWTLAQRFLMSGLQNKLMEALWPLVKSTEGDHLRDFLHYAYEDEDDRKELKRLAADRMAWTTSASSLNVWIAGGHLPEGMLLDILASLKKDHVHGMVPTRNFDDLGTAKDYYVEAMEKNAVLKEEQV